MCENPYLNGYFLLRVILHSHLSKQTLIVALWYSPVGCSHGYRQVWDDCAEPISMWQPQCRYLSIHWCWMLITTTVWEQLPVMSLITRMKRKALIALSCALCFLLEWLEITRKHEKGWNNHKPVWVSIVKIKTVPKVN